MKFKCDILYPCPHRQYIFLLGKPIQPTKEKELDVENLDPQHTYTCSSQVFYNHRAFANGSKTIETDFASEYITYIYVKVPFLYAHDFSKITENDVLGLEKRFWKVDLGPLLK